MKKISLVFALLLCSGCVTPSVKSMNIQRCGIRCVGDTATTVSLESLPNATEANAVKVKIKEIALSIQLFLKEGKVADLTLPEITQELEKLIPEQYRFLLDIAIAQIQGVTLDVGKIGADNIERINSLCIGVIRGCDLYDVKYRPVTDDVKSKVVLHGDLEARFGSRLKNEMGVR